VAVIGESSRILAEVKEIILQNDLNTALSPKNFISYRLMRGLIKALPSLCQSDKSQILKNTRQVDQLEEEGELLRKDLLIETEQRAKEAAEAKKQMAQLATQQQKIIAMIQRSSQTSSSNSSII
jgi:hypothetical protein